MEFTNTATVTAKRVLFVYTVIGKDGAVLLSETHEAKGSFSTGALIQGGNPITCQDGEVYVGDGQVRSAKGAGSFVASVAQVDYVDGTSWHAGPDIPGAILAQPDADVRITQAISWEAGTNTQECVSFTNAGTRIIHRVHFTLSHIADDGSDVVDDPLDYRINLSPGASQQVRCRGWNGSATPAVGAPPDSVPTKILVFDKPARLVAWVDQVDYTDGTSWHA